MAAANVNPPNKQVQPPSALAANVVIHDTVQTEILQLLRAIAANNNNRGLGGRNGRGGNRDRGNRSRVNRCTHDNAGFDWRITTIY